MGRSSPVPSPSLQNVEDDGPDSLQDQDSDVSTGGTLGTSPSADNESDEEESMAMLIVGEFEDASSPPSPSSTHISSESGNGGPPADTDGEYSNIFTLVAQDSDNCVSVEIFAPDLIVGEVTEDNDLLQRWPSVPVSDESSQSGWGSMPGSPSPSPQHMELIVGEIDGSEGELVGWHSQSEDEGSPLSSPGSDSSVSSPDYTLLIVGELEDGDSDSPPQSSTDGAMDESSSANMLTAGGDDSDDPSAVAKDSLTCKSPDDSTVALH